MEQTHISSRFDKDLDKIKTRILNMGNLVIEQIQEATDVIEEFDSDDAQQVIATDHQIIEMRVDISARAERMIALRQPMAVDLRSALAPVLIARELERIGSHAKSTAKRSRKLQDFASGQEINRILLEMSSIIQGMLSDVLIAYKNDDIDLASKAQSRDSQVDTLNRQVFDIALKAIADEPEHAKDFIRVILLARRFERVGDHVVNMSAQVHQLVTGENIAAPPEEEE